MAYRAVEEAVPEGITAHSVRGAATSAAFKGVGFIRGICRAATWASPHIYTRRYHIHTSASAEVAFGRRVLQSVVRT